MKLAQLCRHRAKIAAGRAVIEGAPEAAGGMGAQLEEAIRGQAEGVERRCIGHAVREPELMRCTIDMPEAVPAIIGLPQIKVVEMCQRDDRGGLAVDMLGGRQADGLRLKAWNPELRLIVRRCFGVAGEIATPSAWRMPPGCAEPIRRRAL